MNHWTTSLDQNIPVDILYLDFQKAFDSVPHYCLFVKLEAYGIRGKLLGWISFSWYIVARKLYLMVFPLIGQLYIVESLKDRGEANMPA